MAKLVMGGKTYKPTTVYVLDEVHAAAKEQGLNFSRIMQNALFEELNAQERDIHAPTSGPSPDHRHTPHMEGDDD